MTLVLIGYQMHDRVLSVCILLVYSMQFRKNFSLENIEIFIINSILKFFFKVFEPFSSFLSKLFLEELVKKTLNSVASFE